ncbi:MAG: hypothetical protein KKI08_21440 [Armatimonadetes bacterium]|nr:hypothetical protein [Armatimonadota bacterium]
MHQYWRPGGEQFVGDCMPFWHDGVFHLYALRGGTAFLFAQNGAVRVEELQVQAHGLHA